MEMSLLAQGEYVMDVGFGRNEVLCDILAAG
jgi:hypothetical protein